MPLSPLGIEIQKPRKNGAIQKKVCHTACRYTHSATIFLPSLSIWLFNVMLVLLVAIPLVIFILNYVLPGAFSDAAGSGNAVAELSGEPCSCAHCAHYNGGCNISRIGLNDNIHHDNGCKSFVPRGSNAN